MAGPVHCLPAGETEIRALSAQEAEAFRRWCDTGEAPEHLRRFFETSLFCEAVAPEGLTPRERERLEAIERRGPTPGIPHAEVMREIEERLRARRITPATIPGTPTGEPMTPAERARLDEIEREGLRTVPHSEFERILEERRRRGV